MPSKTATAGIAVLAFVVGAVSMGGGDSDQVKTETVVKTVEVPVTKVEEVEVQTPLPEVCQTIPDTFPPITASDSAQSKQAGILLLAAQDLATGVATNDVSAVNEQITIIRNAKGELGTIVNRRQLDMLLFKTQSAQCEDALGD